MAETTFSPIRRVLVANRGEIARRIMRTCHEMGLSTVAVYSDADRWSPHVRDADAAIALGGDTATESYLDVAKILDAATRTGADAVHPGYGFLAENADFADSCIAAGLTWIGPPAEAMRAMASKVEAKRLVAGSGVPLLPGATVTGDDEDSWAAAAAEVGYPLLVKASAGGGGKGMRRVDEPAALADAVRAGRREAASSFGDPTVFLERLLVNPRHVEVQVLADAHGHVVHLFERDCSVQRRHQKVVEEAPAPGLPEGLRERLHSAAIAVAATIGYTNAGTIEFLVSGDEFFFLEMNTRLQVEHPVTEEITGLDLVRLQIEIAEGRPLPFGQDAITATGHAIEVRLYAEDPRRDFMPSIGRVVTLRVPPTDGIRWELGIESGSEVSPHYDPMLAKIVARGRTRVEAAQRLGRALRALTVAGIVTNRDSLIATLEHEEFLDGPVHTGFYELHPEALAATTPPAILERHAVAAALVGREQERQLLEKRLPPVAPPGWRNVGDGMQRTMFDSVAGGPLTVVVPPAGWTVLRVSAESVEAEIDGERHVFTVEHDGDRYFVGDAGSHSELLEQPRFPSHAGEATQHGPSAPMPGTVVAVSATPGQHVEAGDLLVILEAMKMEHRLVADAAGTVEAVLVAEGDRVDAHQLLVAVNPD